MDQRIEFVMKALEPPELWESCAREAGLAGHPTGYRVA